MQDYVTALRFLSDCLFYVHNKRVIILIDEYDVPLEHAWYGGFYDEMIGFLRSLFESALKKNPNLEFAVMTGCLRISEESIFTGLNNLEIISIITDAYGEHFGFQQSDVDDILKFYNKDDKHGIIKDWYEGYLFGNTAVYNPWRVINYVKALRQIEEKRYNDWLPEEGYTEVLDYGIAFFKKQCRVKAVRKKF